MWDVIYCHNTLISLLTSSLSPCPHHRRKPGPSHCARCHGYPWRPAWPSVSRSGCSRSHTTGRSPVRQEQEEHKMSLVFTEGGTAVIIAYHLQYHVNLILIWSIASVSLTSPMSRMKQSPVLKLSQLTGTSVALTTRRPLTCNSRCITTSLVTTCLNPDATPPCWKVTDGFWEK